MPLGIASTIFSLIFMVVVLIAIKLIKDRRIASVVEADLATLESNLAKLQEKFKDDSIYLRFSKATLLKEELSNLKVQAQAFKNAFLRKKINAVLNQINDFEKDIPNIIRQTNENFFQKESERAKQVFTDKDGKSLLTEEQLKAVLCDDNRNLIIAGAGSGKTRVIDFKVRYLVNYKNISPEKILLLSFSRKSAGDLVKKISENVPGINARTIHSFARQVVGGAGKNIFDESSKEFESIVIKALVQTLRDSSLRRIFHEFYGRFFSDMKPLIFYKSLADLREDLKKVNSKLEDTNEFGEIQVRRSFKTLKGEFVRSVDERYIADFLYLHEIKYEYEKRYPHSDSSYFPDFYLPEYDIYFEHFAITESGNPPAYFGDPKFYLNGMQWKRKLHQEKKTRLVESYSYLLNGKDSSAYLTEVLSKGGVLVYAESDNEELFTKISRQFCRVFTKFYHTFKLSDFSLEGLKQKYPEKRYFLFLQIFERFLSHVEDLVKKENKMDFNDMLIDAIAKYSDQEERQFDYIVVDEFQDTSNLAMKLLDKVFRSYPTATLLSVGDDWQSIYGFNGSDVTILSDYKNRYAGVSIQYLNSNFRSHSKIVELGKQFVSENPAQIKKNVVSKNEKFKQSEIGFLSFEEMEEKIQLIPDDESIFILYRYNDGCPVDRGIFKDFFVMDRYRKPVRTKNCRKNISMMTIHASKGLEAQHVFVLFPDGVNRKFPSDIEDHFVFNMLKTTSDDFPFSEERRLMYVAITRAEQNLYFVSSKEDPNSVFWDELKKLYYSD